VNVELGRVIRSYELGELVGTGGFGAVYRARQPSVAREVAIKIIWPAFANQPSFIRRFEAEAQLVAALEHPHIVPVYDYWRDPEGAYIVMRYLRGGPLRTLGSGRDLPLRQVAQIVEQVATALALAHRYGVVHRDIKPENILLDEERNAYLADFGIAQIISAVQQSADEFSSMGSPAYAAPEVMLGHSVTIQSDIYSLGIVVFELLSGEYPYPGLEEMSQTQLISMRTKEPLPPLFTRRPELPRPLTDVLMRATALNPSDRYADALSFHEAFREALGQGAVARTAASRSLIRELVPNPYRGLRAFAERDAHVFYGRESLVRRLLSRMMQNEEYHRFLAVVGPSGSGKSSVVRAGLIPMLRKGALPGSEQWFYSDFVPGSDPMQELVNLINSLATTPPPNFAERIYSDEQAFGVILAEVLPDDGSEVFLLVDQFEEVFTLSADDRAAERFIHSLFYALTMPDSRLRLVVTIRADFYDRPLLTPRIAELVRERTEVVVPLSAAELERVIVEPARSVGVHFDPALVALMIADVQAQPGALPLLQYALTELFERREGDQITQKAYHAVGGVKGALARRADDIYDRFDAARQEAMRQLFLRLITLGEGTEDTRRRALLTEITGIAGYESADAAAVMQSVIDTLGRARLITFDRDPITRSPTVEVTHEAIIREWGRLRAWLDESREDVRLERNLSVMAQEWEKSGRDSSFLLRGVRLQQYERWMEMTQVSLTLLEKEYLDASIAVRDQQAREEAERVERERRLERRTLNLLRLIIAGLIVIVVGAVSLTAFALRESARAEEAARVADENATISRSIALASNAQTLLANNDTDLALLLALEANRIDNPPSEARATLAQAALARSTYRRFEGGQAALTAAAISADSRLAAASSNDASVRVWDVQTGALVYTLTGHAGDVTSVDFSRDGRWLVSGAVDFTAIVWDLTTGRLERRLTGHGGVVNVAIFSPDGQRVLTGSNDGTVIIWDWQSGQPLLTFDRHGASVNGLDISPDSAAVLSGSRNGRVLYWNAATGEVIADLSASPGALNDLQISSDGRLAVVAKAQSGMMLWDLTTAAPIRAFVGRAQEARTVAFTPDGRYVVSGTLDGEVHLWSTAAGLLEERLLGHTAEVLGVAVSRDGRLALSSSRDATMRIWRIVSPGQLETYAAHVGRVSALTQAARSRYSIGVDGSLLVYPPEGEPQRIVLSGQPLLTFAVDPTETFAVVGGREGRLERVNLATGAVEGRFEGHSGNVLHVVLFDEGRRLLSSTQTGELFLWDTATGELLRRFDVGVSGAIYSFDLLSGGARVAAGLGSNAIGIFDVATGQRLSMLVGHSGSVYSVDVSPDSRFILTGGRDGFAILWDASTGAERARLTEDGATIWSVAFNALGDQFAVGTANGQISIYDAATVDRVQRFSFEEVVFTLTFSADGRRLYSGHNDGRVAAWVVFRGDDATAWAQANRYIRELTCFERDLYRVEPLCADA
jgi:WD40 repeat protein